jgi:nitroreductase
MQRKHEETLELIHRRRSVRAFADTPVPEGLRREVIEATLRAPTAGNMMLYSVIDIRSRQTKERLAVTCDNQPWIATAPMVLVFLADYQRWMDFFDQQKAPEAARAAGWEPRAPGVGDLMLATSDALIAAQNAALAAESLGLGSCYIGDILENYEEHRRLLDLPPLAMPVTMLCIGYPKREKDATTTTPRLAPETVVHLDRYRRITGKELENAFEPLRSHYFERGSYFQGALNMGQHYYLKKFTAPFSREMDRSVREAIQRWELAGNDVESGEEG